MAIYESGENYLETILVLKKRNGSVRSIDIANELGYSKPSISHAMKLLKEKGYIQIDDGGHIGLTQPGKEIAENIYERHELLTSYLIALGVDDKIADADACRIEHIISEETFLKIREDYEKRKGA